MNKITRKKRISCSKTISPNTVNKIKSDKNTIQQMLDEGYRIVDIGILYNVKKIDRLTWLLNSLGIKINRDKIDQWKSNKIQEMIKQGCILKDIQKALKTTPKTIKKIMKNYNIPYVFRQTQQISDKIRKQIIDLHINKGLRPVAISKIIKISTGNIVGFLMGRGIYKRLRGKRKFFTPAENDAQRIDHWYSLPPQGEGRSLVWIGRRFGVSGDQVSYWFKKTGRSIRSFDEQVKTKETKKQLSDSIKIWWEQVGGLEGYLTSLSSRIQAKNYLGYFFIRLHKLNPDKAFGMYNKYSKIIEDHSYIDD